MSQRKSKSTGGRDHQINRAERFTKGAARSFDGLDLSEISHKALKGKEKIAPPTDILYSPDLDKKHLVESYEGLNPENKRLLEAFVDGLTRTQNVATNAVDPKVKRPKRRGGPDIAPMLYADRADESENVIQFVIRAYGGGDPKGGWLDGNMTLADLRHLDTKCARALQDFQDFHYDGRIPLTELNLPTVKEYNDAKLALPRDEMPRNEQRRLQLLEANRRLDLGD